MGSGIRAISPALIPLRRIEILLKCLVLMSISFRLLITAVVTSQVLGALVEHHTAELFDVSPRTIRVCLAETHELQHLVLLALVDAQGHCSFGDGASSCIVPELAITYRPRPKTVQDPCSVMKKRRDGLLRTDPTAWAIRLKSPSTPRGRRYLKRRLLSSTAYQTLQILSWSRISPGGAPA